MSTSSSTGTPASGAGGTVARPTLADIEREIARRAGPFRQVQAASGTGATLVATALMSSIELGSLADLFLLRRGYLANGTAVPGFVSTDRVRTVKVYTPSTGTLEPDRIWSVAPVATELVELHHLDPADELRVAAQAGLWRCYFEDRVSLALASAAPERDLTALAAWILDPSQVRRVEYAYASATDLPAPVGYHRAYEKSGSVWLQVGPDPYPQTLLVTARRPAATWVDTGAGFATSATGPTADNDKVSVDLYYAAAAGHIEAWRRFRPRLQPVAQTGLYADQATAAAEFSRLAKDRAPRVAGRITLGNGFGLRRTQLP